MMNSARGEEDAWSIPYGVSRSPTEEALEGWMMSRARDINMESRQTLQFRHPRKQCVNNIASDTGGHVYVRTANRKPGTIMIASASKNRCKRERENKNEGRSCRAERQIDNGERKVEDCV